MAIKVANNQSMTGITALPSAISGGAWTLISTTTASSSATLSITSGLDDTYDAYCFKFINIHPASSSFLTFQASTDGGSNYNTTCTSSIFSAYQNESGSSTALGYNTSRDAAQSTSFIPLQVDGVYNDSDSSFSGQLFFYDPSDTTFVKHFIFSDSSYGNVTAFSDYTAGYFNTTSAINAMQFKMDSGNLDAGVIKLYGIS